MLRSSKRLGASVLLRLLHSDRRLGDRLTLVNDGVRLDSRVRCCTNDTYKLKYNASAEKS